MDNYFFSILLVVLGLLIGFFIAFVINSIRVSAASKKIAALMEQAKKEIEKIIINDDWGAKPDYWRCHYLCDVSGDCEYRNAS